MYSISKLDGHIIRIGGLSRQRRVADLMNGQSFVPANYVLVGWGYRGRLTDRIRPSETFPRGIDGRFITTLRVHFEDTTLVDPQTWEQFGRHVTDLTVGGEL